MKKAVIILSILALIASGCGQATKKLTNEQIEKDLVESYKNILSARFDLEDWEKLDVANKVFKEKLINYTSSYLSTLTYGFDSLNKEIKIVTSNDGLFRIYSWDTQQGGTMLDFENVFQYEFDGGVCVKASKTGDGIFNPFYSEIFTLKANGKTYYLAINNDILSSKDVMQSIKVFTIENSSLDDTVKLFKTKTQLLNEINVGFDFFSVVDRPERPVRLIKYDPKKKIVYIPVVLEGGKVTDRYILYQFNGQYFEHILTQKKTDKKELSKINKL